MPIRPQVSDTAQIGVEATAGTAVAAGVRLGSLGIVASPNIDAKAVKPTGYKFATMSQANTDETALKLAGAPAYIEAPYVWSGILGTASVSTPTNGVKTRDWTWSPSTTSAETFITYSLEQGNNAIRAQHTKQCRFSELTFTFSRQNGCTWAGAGFGQRLHDNKLRYIKITDATGGTFTITVGANTTSGLAYNASTSAVQTAVQGLASVGSGNATVTGSAGDYRILFTGAFLNAAIPTVSVSGASLTGTGATATLSRMAQSPIEYTLAPIQGNQLDLYLADTYAGLSGASRFTQGFGGEFKMAGRQEGAYFIDSTQESWSEAVEGDPTGTLKLTVAADDVGMTFLDRIRTTATLFVRVLATGSLIESVTPDYYQTQRLDLSVKVLKISEKKAQGQVVAYDFDCELAHDATWGYAMQCFVRTNLATLGSASL